MKHLAVLTSGGDAPGMNAAIRAVVRAASYHGRDISGIYRGYQGLIDNDVHPLGPRSVANTIQRGGTILRTARCKAFYTPEGRAHAAQKLHEHGIEGLIVIGGDGSFRGAAALAQEHDIAVVGVPGTIDNDIYGSDLTIGFDTAINVALDAIDRLRDTAASHDRLFLVEVMGRDAGHIALNVGVAGGAEAILIPEHPVDIGALLTTLHDAVTRGKSSSIIVVAEGAFAGGALRLAEVIEQGLHYDVRTSILGHTQRGGSPSTSDRVLASRLGYVAVKALLEGQRNVMVGTNQGRTVTVPLTDMWGKKREIDQELLELAKVLAV